MPHPMIRRRRALLLAAAVCTAAAPSAAAQTPPTPRGFVLHRTPGCGCCLEWARRMEEAGWRLAEVRDTPDLAPIRRAHGVPPGLAGCHTALFDAGGLVIEGHVPPIALRRLLETRRGEGWRGLAVPGMPLGSPGMEVLGQEADIYTVFAFAADGRHAPLLRARGEAAIDD
jgi:hypothetical protein